MPKGPRLIDMDILLFGSSIVRTPELEIPHPRMAERRFVLVPFSEIAPDARHPVLKKTIAELLEATNDRSEVRKTAFQPRDSPRSECLRKAYTQDITTAANREARD